jgi:hypothetical protein
VDRDEVQVDTVDPHRALERADVVAAHLEPPGPAIAQRVTARDHVLPDAVALARAEQRGIVGDARRRQGMSVLREHDVRVVAGDLGGEATEPLGLQAGPVRLDVVGHHPQSRHARGRGRVPDPAHRQRRHQHERAQTGQDPAAAARERQQHRHAGECEPQRVRCVAGEFQPPGADGAQALREGQRHEAGDHQRNGGARQTRDRAGPA